MHRLQNLALIGISGLMLTAVTACGKTGDEAVRLPSAEVDAPPDSPAAADPAPGTAETSASWPRFNGPKGDNLSTETGLLKKWPKGGPPLLWTAKGIGDGFGFPSIAGGLIYVSGNVNDETTVTALDLAGKILWQMPAGEAWTDKRKYPGARGTPTVDDGRVYHESPLGQVVCLDAKTDRKIWSVNILDRFDAKNITWALAESVLIDGKHVICCPGGKKASVAALDKRSGKTVWTTKSTDQLANYATPVLIEYQGLRILLTMSQKGLIGVNADNGDLLFQYPHETAYDINATSPIFHDGRIFITSGYGSGSEMLQLTVNGRKASVKNVWTSKDLDNHHGGVVLLDGYLYGSSFRGKWICLAWKDGATQYAERGVGKGSLTYADGMFYMWSEKGNVGLAPATPEKLEIVSQFRVAEGGQGPTWAHPVVCGGRLYLRHGNVLHAYDIRAGK
ncbi:MAG: PQQ-like beta-propeller repeat protein [Pirellulales bacterium]|nr:PQQ-like beta-propeller repeat protein [Pirellulales bacterium]